MAKKLTSETRKRVKPKNVLYQMKVTLKNLRPPIWRRIQVTGDTKLDAFHRILQTVMGWTDSHLHEFFIHDESYGDISQLEDDTLDERKFRLNELISVEKEKFFYLYDFGDSWHHEILVEKILPADARFEAPRCIAGRRACPPEDCGGPWGYEDLLTALSDPSHPEHEDSLEWVEEDFDPAIFHIETVNVELKHI